LYIAIYVYANVVKNVLKSANEKIFKHSYYKNNLKIAKACKNLTFKINPLRLFKSRSKTKIGRLKKLQHTQKICKHLQMLAKPNRIIFLSCCPPSAFKISAAPP
jgi:hypothetical protein